MAGIESRLVSLPLSRVRLIMKSSPDVSSINQDALILTAKATELFVKYLAAYAFKHGTGKESNALTYDDLSNTAEESETFQFLSDIFPKKILGSDYLKMLEKEVEGVSDADEEDDKEEEEEEEDDDDEEGEEGGEGEEEAEEEESDDSDEEDEDYEQDDNEDDDEQ
ncbi:chromatin accessibility complex protein 1 [Rhinoderma darwinii]|uniref:chromatin accessibility complex protein 1 n=1 Tax=Rhinoderma darwinii TaxID=43563 RepID=UPI003F67DC8D